MPKFISDEQMSLMEPKQSGFISDEDMAAKEAAPQEDWKQTLLRGLGTVANTIDSYSGAPVRAGIGALQDDKGVSGALGAYAKQFGNDPSLAPTGKMIAEKGGTPNTPLSHYVPGLYNDTGEGWQFQKGGPLDVTRSGVTGFGIDVLADPVNVLPVGKLVEMTGKGVQAAKAPMTRGFARTAEALTGIPARETETYVSKFQPINQMSKKFGGDVSLAADETRRKFTADIAGARRNSNELIASGMKIEQTVDPSAAIDTLHSHMAKLDPVLNANDIEQIDDVAGKIFQMSHPNGGKLTAKQGYALKKYLGDMSKGSYLKDGQIFQTGTEAAKATKSAGWDMAKVVHDVSPEMAAGDRYLSTMHGLEKRMNKNLIAGGTEAIPGGSDAALLAAGSGNQRNARALQSMGKLTGTDMVGEAEKLSAMNRFAKPALLPVDSTGKSFTRMAAGRALVGAGVAGAAGENPLYGLAATSPAALKATIAAGHYAGRFAAPIASYAGKAMSSPAFKPLYQAGRAIPWESARDFFVKSQQDPSFREENSEQK